ncbi:MAG: zinc ribbon domain-containing protein [Elusimicrobia bacterium]|nr:zinc ribbon domain-containing protein [Elusimicrobiota bacterium]
MASKPSVIKCPKCGYQPNIISDTCLKCGTRLEKACGDCGFGNSVEKNYCDGCGSLLALNPPPKDASAPVPPPAPSEGHGPTLEMESIQDTVTDRAQSFRRRAPEPEKPAAPSAPARPQQPAAPAAPQPQAQKPGDDRDSMRRGMSPMMADSSRLRKDVPPPNAAKPALFKRLAGPVLTGALALVLLVIIYLIIAPSIPRLRLVMTAKSYLTNISEGRFDKAYELLSANSRAAVSKDEYVKNSKEYYAKAPAWQFREVQVFALDKDAAMVRYELKEGNADWKPDYISFVREHNRWARPYIWIMFQPIEDAIKRQDFPQALFLAQKLYLTDPVDPRSSGYLCSSEFFMGLYDKASESCRRTIDGAETYPVGYSSEELYWFNLCYADSLRYLQRDRVAIQEYEKLMKWPGLTTKEQCPLFLNRADSYVAIQDYNRALQDIMSADGVCFEPTSKAEAKKRLNYLSGSALTEAVAFAQKSRFQQGMPPIGEARRQQLEAMKARLGPQNARFLPKDQWLAAHVKGPEYRVFLRQTVTNPRTHRQEVTDVFIFLVNLWSGKAKVEKAPPAPPPPGAPPARDN